MLYTFLKTSPASFGSSPNIISVIVVIVELFWKAPESFFNILILANKQADIGTIPSFSSPSGAGSALPAAAISACLSPAYHQLTQDRHCVRFLAVKATAVFEASGITIFVWRPSSCQLPPQSLQRRPARPPS